jgi:hypothetical protein
VTAGKIEVLAPGGFSPNDIGASYRTASTGRVAGGTPYRRAPMCRFR